MWIVLKTIALTAAAWGVAAAAFALVMWAALGSFAQTARVTYGQTLGGIIAAIVAVAAIRFAIVAPLLTVDLVIDGYGARERRHFVWSIIEWPLRK